MGLSDIGEQVGQWLATAGRSLNTTDPGVALLRRTNTVLMVFDDNLYHLDSGRSCRIPDSAVGTRDESSGGSIDGRSDNGAADASSLAMRLATAAASLLADGGDGEHISGISATNSTASSFTQNTLLLLPPADFLATPVNLPGVAAAAIRPALRLQADSLVPGYDDALSVAVSTIDAGSKTADDAQSQTQSQTQAHMAFWLPTATLNALHRAFADQSLFLTAVMPRTMLIAGQQDMVMIDDQDARNQSVLLFRDGVCQQCLQTSKTDLAIPAFHDQWQAETAVLTASAPEAMTLHSADDYRQAMGAQQLRSNALPTTATAYAIVPDAALAARHQFDKGKRLWRVAAVIAALTVLSSIPFLIQTLQLRSLNNTLAEQQQRTAPARADQQAVRDFESRWGVLTEYPAQDVPAMLLALQAEVSPNVLTSLELEEGYISIEGESNDPQGLLQQLEQNPMFTEVDFARATNNNRFYIDLRLTTVNFPAYQEWYFPEEQ
ncbi:hypothetical protein PHACT_09360 [Pseudohongiella acticola]|uniref:GspL cytoplasmic actin-ATPase-like domain-containing protein n=1 Tax=Pseudohongiella acticola TaxID=1524254 RepID=A0A1E8CLJ4_9GAMM|nr:DUF1772 domain-containing protein [Pseudohongiella acticola]OFE13320.1 hypothetical protein PHACT_09360 [Pseudohongiella acticola]